MGNVNSIKNNKCVEIDLSKAIQFMTAEISCNFKTGLLHNSLSHRLESSISRKKLVHVIQGREYFIRYGTKSTVCVNF